MDGFLEDPNLPPPRYPPQKLTAKAPENGCLEEKPFAYFQGQNRC